MGALPPNPQDLPLYGPKHGDREKGRAKVHGPMLRSPAPALGLLPSIALSSETGGNDITYTSIKLQRRL